MEQPPSTRPPAYASETLLRLPAPRCPEDRLMLAVLLDAVAVLREHATGLCPHRVRLVNSTARWFAAPDASWPLSYVNVCRALGLDPVELRDGLRRELTDLGGGELLDPSGPRVLPFGDARAPAATGAVSPRRRSESRPRG